MLGLLHLRGHGLCAVLTMKLPPEEHAATIRNEHDPNTHWLEKTLLSPYHDAIVRCYHQRQTHIAAMPPWRVSVSLRPQRDCRATAKQVVPSESTARHFSSALTGATSTTLGMRAGSSSKQKSARSVQQMCPHFARTLMSAALQSAYDD
jgi:hypothetical protein